MVDFVQYVVSELSSKRLSKADALALIKQFHFRSKSETEGSVIHPLLQRNTSDLNQQSYTTRFDGEELFLRDHQVNGRKVLPGVAYLEMVRAAIASALPSQEEFTIELQNVVWAQPIVVTEKKEVTIALFSNGAESDKKHIDYEIYSVEGDADGSSREVIHSQGRASITSDPAPARLDIERLKAQMGRGELAASAIYPAYEKMGIRYGPSHKGIAVIHRGERQLLAQLSLPVAAGDTLGDYLLHPSLMDAALQSPVGLIDDIDKVPDRPTLPFALESLRILSACTSNMVAWVRYSPGSGPEDKLTKLDIDLCDPAGNICVQMRGFTSRALNTDASGLGSLYAAPVWETKTIDESSGTNQHEYQQRHVVLCGLPKVNVEQLEAVIANGRCLPLQATPRQNIAERYSEGAVACFELIKNVLERKPQGKVLVQVVVANNTDESLFAGLSGLLKTAAIENPALVGQILMTEPEITAQELAKQLQAEKNRPQDTITKYERGIRHVLELRELQVSEGKADIAFKGQGVYLITGGLGGLGVLFAKEILERTHGAKIVLTGRSELTPDKKAILETLSSQSGSVEYRQLDITDLDQVRRLIAKIIEENERLTGIIHSAGMLADNFILKKTSAEFRQVLEPKVTGTFNLDEASKEIDLDFMVLFSAAASVTGNNGQADYAAANGFMDQFAHRRNQWVADQHRHGKTLAINWPLWLEGGMGVDNATRERLKQAAGMHPMRTSTGMQAFHRSLESRQSQIQIVEGDLSKLRNTLLADQALQSEPLMEPPRVDRPDTGSLRERTQDYLKRQLSSLLKLAASKIDPSAPFEKYGINSIMMMDLTHELEKSFGSLPKTLFFEYQSISELSQYFIKSHSVQLSTLFGNRGESAESKPQVQSRRVSNRRVGRQRHVASAMNAAREASSISTDPIAIIGLSGRYPEATNIEAYWRNLREGKDCIIEVPKDRWDWREYFTEDRSKSGHHYSKWGGFIDGVDEFDPQFFNISPREARSIDPQERLFLQHAWLAVEDAGYTRASLQVPHKQGLAGQVGVYVGVMYGEYNLSGSLASIANRVSYVLNLHGPSMTLDTMCSSSLTAIHLACQDLKQGRTDVAIAGGVNVSIHPSKYLLLSAGQFISSDGHCQSFGEGGDGYIPGEGVGAVVLKRLSDAKKARDHIYGIIKGSALNHGGKTNGYTVPNPQAQVSVISQALAESNTNPRHISYVEAHGTGTKLGDPIEIAALSKAFYPDSQEASAQRKELGFCAIGSAKSNIGHCESAAGIAGLTKVLLQIQHRQIVPSLHSARLNPNIDFDSSPFVVNQSLKAWDRPVIDGRQLPRIAGLSSFGAGGSNAHIIVEEYMPPSEAKQPASHTQVIIPLSARTAGQLKQRARDLLDFIRASGQDGHPPLDLPAMAYTLQVGREAMEERLGFVVSSAAKLAEKLRAYIDGEQDIEDAAQGQVKSDNDTLSLFSHDADLQDTVDKWIARKNLSRLLHLWVKGLELNWGKLYGEAKPRRISLPTYPFAKEKYWIETVGQVVAGAVSRPATTTAALHPLLHANTSDLSEQSYGSTFSGEESFFSDHRVHGQKILPAMACLEMARAAVAQATRTQPESGILELQNIVWGQPVAAKANREITIALFANDDEQIDYEIYSRGKDLEIVHCQGQATFSHQPAPAKLDIAQLRARMGQRGLDIPRVYSTFAEMGLDYGPAHQGIAAIHKGEKQLLAQLSLPTAVAASQSHYLLHPSLMDGALQASIALIHDLPQVAGRPPLPFSLDTLRIVFACVKEMFAWVRHAQGNKVDVDLCDPQGNVCVQMRGLSLQQLAMQQAANAPLAAIVAKPQSVQLISLQKVDDAASGTLAGAKPESVQLIGLQEVAPVTSGAAVERDIPSGPASQQSLNVDPLHADAPQSDPSADEPEAVFSQEQLQQQLKESLAQALYMQASDIDSAKSFVDLGLDSIVGVEWVKVINKRYGLALSATRVYDYPSIKELTSFVEKEIEKLPASPKPAAAKPQSVAPRKATVSASVHEPSASSVTSHPSLKRRTRVSRASRNELVPSQTGHAPSSEKIAIVGMSGRYPQASNLQQYWNNLAQGRNSIVEIPPSRWDVSQYYDQDPTRKGKIYCKWLGMLDDVDCFDPLFFQISPAQAQSMDPQHRLFMQEAYRAFEDAGYSNKALSNKKCGVYLGIMSNEYALLLSRSGSTNVDTTGTSYAIGAARIAYYLNLKGPAIPIDTACSSSLVAMHLACQGLLNREIDMALAGGVTLYLTADSYLGMCQAGMLSPDGQCKAFDNGANGFVPGEGVGALVLKRLQDAERDNDFIHGVILGSGINQDGKTNGITAPSVNSQVELEREVYAKYKIDPETIGYVETHGTGTKLGDPIELEALATVFGEKTAKKNYCALGSVKSNIGHTSGAAGVASVQKVLLSMRHRTLAPSLNVTEENALFDFKNSPFYICREKRAWDAPPNSPRRASVSSFGFSGTNAHLVIEEYAPPENRPATSNSAQNTEVAVLLSARTAAQLHQKARDLLDFVILEKRSGTIDLTAMAYTLQVGREALKERLGFVAASIDQLAEKLQAYVAGTKNIKGVYEGQVARDKGGSSLFGTDADLREVVDKWIAGRKLSSLLDLWVKGLELDWGKLYTEENRPRRISLPTYPFAKERYWTTTRAVSVSVGQNSVTESKKEAVKADAETKRRTYYYPRWKVSVLEASKEQASATGPILILDTTDELFLKVKDQLGGSSILVKPAKTYQEIAPDTFTIDFEREEHFHRLIETLKTRDPLPGYVLHHCPGPNEQGLGFQLNHGIYALFYLCKALMMQKHQGPLRILSVFYSNANKTAPHYAALGGFFRALTLENPKYLAKVVDVRNFSENTTLSISEKAHLILGEFQDENWQSVEVRYQQRLQEETPAYVRHVRELAPYHPDERMMAELPLKQNGLYIITGGLGGLGFIFGEYLVKNFHAKLAVLGRSPLTTAQEEKLLQLRSHQTDVIYLQADVSKLQDVESAVQEAKARFSEINGVIHSAGVNRDSFILKKTREEMESVLASKIYGTINLDQATIAENLDLFVMFSSIAGAMGNLGQCDYSYGNHFLDSFAESRENLRNKQERSGKTLSINWPFWKEGGMTMSQDDVAHTEAQTGISPLPTTEGVQYWEEFLRSGLSQGVALYGIPRKIEAYVAEKSSRHDKSRLAPLETIDAAILLQETETYLRGLISEEIKLAPERIDSCERFESFGIDSIMVGRLNNSLSRDLGDSPKTLFYEYETIEELAKYFVREVPHVLTRLFSVENSAGGASVDTGNSQTLGTVAEPVRENVQDIRKHDELEPIAIIGVHGYYPQSKDLGEYWENLRQGRDAVSVVPADRWDAETFYDADPAKAAEGKIYCKWGAFLEDFDKFDAPFFNIAAEEARIIDPQERLFLQSVWAAIEDAGYTRESLKRLFPKAKSADVAVFVGVTTNSYQLLTTEEWRRGNMVSPGALPWSIANRASYFFDFQGPSMPVDTACSSSLVAIHLACESLRQSECQVAVAGGVNLYLHPAKYHGLCQKRMLALGGKCRSFGAGDDGFVPGEAVGTLILKPLGKAIEHGDHVYAVIRGSAYDHSGRSNGYSAPNPNSQASLISHVLSKARVHPESIGYIEGHGTGTQLGDGLEIAALTQAFRKQTAKQRFCPVGSVKANLGHSESAAGIAGVTKILLQMKHRQLAPTLHSDEVNPNIEFERSPFYLQHGLSPWEPSSLHPRRALVNSFGAGGVNACVVLEEYERPGAPARSAAAGPHLVVLSARNEDRLRECVDKLLGHVRKEADIDLPALAYTLQVGREAMPERLALVVREVQELIGKLDDWSRQKSSAGVYRGSLDPRRGTRRPSKQDKDMLEGLFQARDLDGLARAWTAGAEVDWEILHARHRSARISLPTYPFVKERYWVSDAPAPKYAATGQKSAPLHPLVSYNSSTLKEVSFSSMLSGNEFYARDHRVNGQRILPGSGFLEMACVAGALAGTKKVRKIQDVVFIQPLAFRDASQMIQISLRPTDNNAEYTIASCDADREKVVHSEGVVCFHDGATSPAGEEYLPLESLKKQCAPPVDGAHCYGLFEKSGISYGPAFRTLQELYIGDSFALSRLSIADHLRDEFEEFVLHPCMIDGALQTVSGLVGGVQSSVPYLPFAIDEVEIIRPTAPACYVHVEQAGHGTQGNAEIRKFNIKISNDKGLVLVSFKNFCVRAFKSIPSGITLSA